MARGLNYVPKPFVSRILVENATVYDNAVYREIEAFAERFMHKHGLKIIFNDEAIEELIRMSVDQDKSVRDVCEDRFKDYEFGLKLIADKTGKRSFHITREAVDHPDLELSHWVVESYPRND